MVIPVRTANAMRASAKRGLLRTFRWLDGGLIGRCCGSEAAQRQWLSRTSRNVLSPQSAGARCLSGPCQANDGDQSSWLSTSSPTTNISIPISPDVMKAIRQLPEIQTSLALEAHQSKRAIDPLTRAADIFTKAMSHGIGRERRAVLALLAQRQGMSGMHKEASITYHTLLTDLSRQPQSLIVPLPLGAWETVVLQLAEAKAAFHAGDFHQSLALSQYVNNHVQDHFHKEFAPLARRAMRYFHGCALNGIGLSHLLLQQQTAVAAAEATTTTTTTTDSGVNVDATSAFREAVTILREGYERASKREMAKREKNIPIPQHGRIIDIGPIEMGMATASIMGNLGLAQDLADAKKASPASERVLVSRQDSKGKQTWQDALALLDTLSPKRNHLDALSSCIRARLHCCIASAILESENSQSPSSAEQLKMASESSKAALKLYERVINSTATTPSQDNHPLKPLVGKALALVASCYAKAGSAVTAEGLYKSAIELLMDPVAVAGSPLSTIDTCDTLLKYAHLCDDWEKREADATVLKAHANDIRQTLPEEWRNLSGAYGCLRFVHPGDFI